ncbi:two-component regulator propeller domain-containing protein [Flavivirga spongiicola]|uniref:histidine kinase n=1 Tax=Flavivirga spongiicola TaxID=421621 RepID=A0ABU7XXV3_9FLAO|nr:two-component regulator propeller domain-containing protein [Flavivirga sp. MEBiC05379]MDO5980225.1 two-component regulator propeller domain-containing protein [Flavivirga sp. MEBiC05379]
MNYYSKIIISFRFMLFVSMLSFGQEKSNFIKLNRGFTATSNVVEDKFGFIRISSSDGIYKYDGYDFSLTTYKTLFGTNFKRDRDYLMTRGNHDNIWISTFNGELTKLGANGVKVSYKEKLTHNKEPLQITAIKPDNDNVWFGAVNGTLFKHRSNTTKIDSIVSLPKINGLNQTVKSIAITNPDDIWVSTFIGKIYKYSLSTKVLQRLDTHLNNVTQNVRITNDEHGKLWIATELQGLYSYDTKNGGAIKQYDNLDSSSVDSKHHMFISIFCDSSGIIWAGTDGDGLYSIDPRTDKINVFKQEETNKFSISNNTVTHISEDAKGNIWIVAKKGKINILPKSNNKISYYSGLESNAPESVLSILKSSDGSLWFGTDGKGLNRVFPNNTKVQYDLNKRGKYFFEGRYIQSLLEDAKGNIWIGTYQKGLWVFNPDSSLFTKINTVNSSGNYSSDVRSLFKDSKNRIWVTSGAAINVFSDQRELLAIFDYDANGLFGNMSMSICEDENGAIWLGINPGSLFKFNEDLNAISKSYFTKHNYYVKQPGDSRNYNIHSLVPDYKGFLWISCASGMLIKYNLINNTFESFADRDHFDGIVISSVLIENPNNLWFSSINGIHHYNLKFDVFKSYYQMDGFQSNNFVRRSSFKDSDGTLYFGNENGVNSFLPTEIDKEDTTAKLYINNIEILNKPASLIVADQVKKDVEYVRDLKLDSDQSSFSFQFSAVDNILNTNYHYAYKLHGFDTEWIVPKKERIASYTNIPYGNYTFEVKAGSRKGAWNIDPIAIDLYIKPPWWYSTPAYIAYLIGSLLLIYGIVLWIRLKNKLVKETWHNNKEKELYALKMNFFAKMSHEIQTPLTLILGPIRDMLERAGTNGNQLLKQRLIMINNNANRLSRIAMELMTVRNKELGKLRLFASKNNLIDDLKRIAVSFSEQARFKNIDFIQKYPEAPINIWYDKDKIEHVIYNLLSNAFKFTPKEGKVSLKVTLNREDQFVKISVVDSGPGIPKEELENIFKLFYQTDLGKHNKGIGIGLALTKELISLHHGEINVDSSPEAGTCFSVKLSTQETIFSEDEKIYIENSNHISNTLEKDFNLLEKNLNLKTVENPEKQYTLLIVEDNIEMQIFLKDVLDNTYNLLIANNGKEGIAMAENNIPDLIISDIMMPLIDGLEMCKILQKKKVTSHIPIILLTAKNTTTTKIKGLKYGAIEYIKKPFNFYELLLKIHNILSSKEKALSKYKTDLISSPEDISTPSKDDTFMVRLVEELNEQIENPDFKLEELSKSLNMSYSVIYRKCQDITGKTLIEFVRSLKLKKAALLIIQHGYNISEAAYMVGYKDSKYFTKCFKEEFGIPPAAIKRETKKTNVEDVIKKYKIQL